MSGLISGYTATASLLELALEGISYGFCTCTFGITVWILIRRSIKKSRTMLIISCILWILSTVRMFGTLVNFTVAFVDHIASGPHGPEEYISAFWTPISMINNLIYAASTLIGDAVVIYRCYIVWRTRSYLIIVLPCLAWLGSFGSVIFLVVSFRNHVVTGQRIMILYVFTLMANLSATLTLAYRIWRVDRNTQAVFRSSNTLRPVLLLVIESGALYTTLLIAALATVLHAFPTAFVINSVMPPMISIIFDLIFLRIAVVEDNREEKEANASVVPLSAIVLHTRDEGESDHHSK